MKLYTASDTGRRRAANEDSADGQLKDGGLCWLTVCDGMGGERGGAVASRLACEEIRRVLESGLRPGMDERSAVSLLQTAMKNANALVYETGRADANLAGMGTTAVVAIVDGGRAHVMHAGDSRAYKITKDEIIPLTKDHSVVQLLLDRGEITPEEARNHHDRHLITKAVGAGEDIHGEYVTCTLDKGDLLLLCSDGLYNMVEADELHALSLEAAAAEDATLLINRANQMGGLDNITAAIAHAQ